MAVDGAAHERYEGRTSSYDGGTWSQNREWLVKTTGIADGEAVASTAGGLPAYGELHPAPVDAAVPTWAKQITYTQFEGPMAWLVTVTYTSERELDEDPENDEVLVSWSSEIYQEPVFQDVFGHAVLNSAGDYFVDPSPTRDAAYLIAKIRTSVSYVPPWVISAQNAVNDADITIGGLAIAPRLAKMQRLEIGERKKRFGYNFYDVSFEIHIRKEGWRLEPLDAGFRVLRPSISAFAFQAMDTDFSEVTMPVPLDGAGQMLNPATPSTAVFLNFQIYNEIDFATLPGVT